MMMGDKKKLGGTIASRNHRVTVIEFSLRASRETYFIESLLRGRPLLNSEVNQSSNARRIVTGDASLMNHPDQSRLSLTQRSPTNQNLSLEAAELVSRTFHCVCELNSKCDLK